MAAPDWRDRCMAALEVIAHFKRASVTCVDQGLPARLGAALGAAGLCGNCFGRVEWCGGTCPATPSSHSRDPDADTSAASRSSGPPASTAVDSAAPGLIARPAPASVMPFAPSAVLNVGRGSKRSRADREPESPPEVASSPPRSRRSRRRTETPPPPPYSPIRALASTASTHTAALTPATHPPALAAPCLSMAITPSSSAPAAPDGMPAPSSAGYMTPSSAHAAPNGMLAPATIVGPSSSAGRMTPSAIVSSAAGSDGKSAGASELVQLTVLDVLGRVMEFPIRLTDTVLSLKNAIHARRGVPVDLQRLRPAGWSECWSLPDHDTLGQHAGRELRMRLHVRRYPDGHVVPIQLFVRTMQGKTITLDVDTTLTILDVMGKIRDREGIPIEQQRLVYAGNWLETDRTVADFDIPAEATLHLVEILRGS